MISSKRPSRRRRSAERSLESIFKCITNRRIGHSVCFLCGGKLTRSNRSDEHVFPAWLQRRFGLWNQKMILMNGTSIPYRLLTIPCCKVCNSKHLSRVEKSVKSAVLSGAKAVRTMDQTVLLVWLSKILYGLVYREHLLYFDQRNPLRGRLVRLNFLKRFKTFHLFMQAARLRLRFATVFPASIFVFNTQVPKSKELQFDFYDSPFLLTIACRLGSVGIIAALQDGGALRNLCQNYMARFQQRRLHPIQFAELTAKVVYEATLLNRIPSYLTMESSGELIVCQLPLQGMTTKPIFDQGALHDFARALAVHTGYPLAALYRPPNQVVTFLEDASGNPIRMHVSKVKWAGSNRQHIQDALSSGVRNPIS